jgi:hypothetical protein
MEGSTSKKVHDGGEGEGGDNFPEHNIDPCGAMKAREKIASVALINFPGCIHK